MAGVVGNVAADVIEPLETARYVSLTTPTKRCGGPTAFGALHRDGKLFCFTDARSGKVKRVRREPRVEVAPCTQRGALLAPPLAARARILEGAEVAEIAAAFDELWTHQFGIMWRIGKAIERLRQMHRVAIEIVVEPAR